MALYHIICSFIYIICHFTDNIPKLRYPSSDIQGDIEKLGFFVRQLAFIIAPRAERENHQLTFGLTS